MSNGSQYINLDEVEWEPLPSGQEGLQLSNPTGDCWLSVSQRKGNSPGWVFFARIPHDVAERADLSPGDFVAIQYSKASRLVRLDKSDSGCRLRDQRTNMTPAWDRSKRCLCIQVSRRSSVESPFPVDGVRRQARVVEAKKGHIVLEAEAPHA